MKQDKKPAAQEAPALHILEDFKPHTYEEWRKAAEELLKGKPFDKVMKSTLIEGITLEPIYRREDIANIDIKRELPGMGAHVRGIKRHPLVYPIVFEDMDGMDALSERLAEADIVASFMPSTPETRGLANAEFFAAMKPGAFFANGGRGDLVVADDLVAALESGHLAGAAVDVTDPEPLPATSPLWDAPNMLITPHVSGWFHLAATLNNVVDIAAENLRHLQAGETLRCWIEH